MEPKKAEKARLVEHFTPTPKRPPFTYNFRFVRVGWGHRRNHPCQVSSQSVHQFRLPRGSKTIISHRLGEWLLRYIRAILGHRSKKANINLVRRRDEIDYLLLQVDVSPTWL